MELKLRRLKAIAEQGMSYTVMTVRTFRVITHNLGSIAGRIISSCFVTSLTFSISVFRQTSEAPRESLTEVTLNRYNTHSPLHTNSASLTNSPSHPPAAASNTPSSTTSAAASFFAR